MPQMSASPMASSLPMAQDKFSASNDPFALNVNPQGLAQKGAGWDESLNLVRSILGGRWDPSMGGMSAFQGAQAFQNAMNYAGNSDFMRAANLNPFREVTYGPGSQYLPMSASGSVTMTEGTVDPSRQQILDPLTSAYNNFLNRFRSTGQFGLSGSYTQGGY